MLKPAEEEPASQGWTNIRPQRPDHQFPAEGS